VFGNSTQLFCAPLYVLRRHLILSFIVPLVPQLVT
jgi:hypothetical protein